MSEVIHDAKPEAITVKITVEAIEEKRISGIPIEITGVNEQNTIDFLSPENGQVDIIVRGPLAAIENLKTANFQAVAEAKGLPPGEHELEILLDGPEGIDWELEQKQLKSNFTRYRIKYGGT